MSRFRPPLYTLLFAMVLLVAGTLSPTEAQSPPTAPGSQPDTPPAMILPVAGTPGPDTWLFGQAYGNTVGSFNFGMDWYSAGQGLHFGIDFPMACGGELVAPADGEVMFVDNLSFGAGPHNLLIYHPELNVVSLFGHLLERANLQPGQPVVQGQVVGLSGDPDSTCNSRPHLHYEVRSPGYRTTYNPVPYIDANWNMLTTIGGYGYPFFQHDLQNPRRWVDLFDQPDVQFGGRMLNRYTVTWPPANADRSPGSAAPFRELEPLPADNMWQLRKIAPDGCCALFWWDASDPAALYVVDGVPGTRADVLRWDIDNRAPLQRVEPAPPTPTSPDGQLSITRNGNQSVVTVRATGEQFTVNTSGQPAAISPDNQRLLWQRTNGRFVPGGAQPPTTFWLSDLNGANARLVREQRGGSMTWLDGERLLVSLPTQDLQVRSLAVLNLTTGEEMPLGIFRTLRNLSISPGGDHVMFYLAFQDDPAQNGVYLLPTTQGPFPQPRRLDWFGAWRWRDAHTLYVLPFNPATDRHTLAYYDVRLGALQTLFTPEEGPFSVMNGIWDVNADGSRIVFQNADDEALWVLERIR